MQDKYADAVRYYEPFVKRQMDDLLSITAIILANICVSLIMISRNPEAEELMKCLILCKVQTLMEMGIQDLDREGWGA